MSDKEITVYIARYITIPKNIMCGCKIVQPYIAENWKITNAVYELCRINSEDCVLKLNDMTVKGIPNKQIIENFPVVV